MALEHHSEQGMMPIPTYQSGSISIPWHRNE